MKSPAIVAGREEMIEAVHFFEKLGVQGIGSTPAIPPERASADESPLMKWTRLFKLTLLLLSGVFMQDSLAREYTRLTLPPGTRARFGEAVLTGEIAYSPNGAWLAAPSTIGIWLYSARTGRLKARLGSGFVRSVAFAPDSRTLAGGIGGEIRLWKVSTGKLKAALDGPAGFVRSMAFAPDGKTLASGGDRTIRLWEVRTGQLRNTLEEHTGEVEALAFSPDRTQPWPVPAGTIRSGCGMRAPGSTRLPWRGIRVGSRRLRSRRTARPWPAAAGTGRSGSGTQAPEIPRLPGRDIRRMDLPNGYGPSRSRRTANILASAHDLAVRLWDVETGQLRATLALEGHESWVSSVAFSPDGNTLASGSRSSNGNQSRHFSVLLWDISPRTKVEAAVLGDMVEGLTVEFSRAISGRRRHYTWSAVTDTAGRLELTLFPGVSGFYEARALTAAGEVVGRWHSIPLNSDKRQFLELTLGGGMQVVSVEQLAAAKVAAPEGLVASELHPNTPNPFNAGTRIAYRLAASGPVRLEIYNLLGQPVDTLVDEAQAAGAYRVSWDARDRRGAAVAAGVYLTRLTFPGGVQTRRLIYLK